MSGMVLQVLLPLAAADSAAFLAESGRGTLDLTDDGRWVVEVPEEGRRIVTQLVERGWCEVRDGEAVTEEDG